MLKFIQYTHWAVLLFVLTAWFYPWAPALWLHVVFVPLMILHWRTNRNRCFLSQLEEKYKVPHEASVHQRVKRDAHESQFIKHVWAKIFRKTPTDRVLNKAIYGIVGLVWAISVARLTMMAQQAG